MGGNASLSLNCSSSVCASEKEVQLAGAAGARSALREQPSTPGHRPSATVIQKPALQEHLELGRASGWTEAVCAAGGAAGGP